MKTMLFVSVLMAGGMIAPAFAEGVKGKGRAEKTQKIATVGGQVRRPGPVPLRNGATLFEVIQHAGGVTEFGSTRRIKVFRKGEILLFDLRDDQQKMTRIWQEDVIEVPQQSIFGRLFKR